MMTGEKLVLLVACILLSLYNESFGFLSSNPTHPTTITDSKPNAKSDPVDSCNESLGMESGKIKEYQIVQISMLSPLYSGNNARLNKTTIPQGYRSGLNSCLTGQEAFIKVEFTTRTVVTGIATQGYGDASVGEWVKSYSLYWQKNDGEQLKPYKPPKFRGNSDANTIVYNRIPQPKEVRSILIMPSECSKDKAGLRFELYGCVIKKTYVLWVRLKNENFQRDLFSEKTQQFKSLESSIKTKVERLISSHKGFLFVNVLRIRYEEYLVLMQSSFLQLPREMSRFLFVVIKGYSPGSVVIQLEVGAVEAEAESLLKTAKETLLSDSDLGLDRNFFLVQDLTGTKYCKPPYNNLSISHSISNPTSILESEAFTITAIVDLLPIKNCRFNGSLVVEWSISQQKPGSQYFGKRTNVTKDASLNALKFEKQTLQHGLYYIEQRIGIPNSRLFHHNFGFVEVVRTPLKVTIQGPSVVAKGYNDFITIDASSSFDPDIIPRSNKGLTFVWFCKRKLANHTSRVDTGCFIGSNRINLGNQSGPILKLPVSKIAAGLEYNVTVIVSKDTRHTMATHFFKVDMVATMNIKISCKQNCGKYSPQKSIVLLAKCQGLICQEIPSYTWRVLAKRLENGIEKWDNVSVEFTAASPTTDISKIIIRKGILTIGVKYMMEITADTPSMTIKSNFTLNANEAPTGGKCYSDAKVGEAFTTMFNLSCVGWLDEEPPLTYKFQFTNPTGIEVLLQSSLFPNVSTKLPVGNFAHDYNLPINVFIADSAGVGRDVTINVKVTPIKVQNSTLFQYTVGEKSRLSILLKNNDIKQATNLANEVLAMMSSNQVTNMSSSDKVKIKDNMMTQMASVNVTNIKKLIQVASVVAGVTENRTELSEQSQSKSVEVIASMATAFSDLPVDIKKGSTRMVTEASTNLLHCMGNILEKFSFSAEALSEDEQTVNKNKTENEMVGSKEGIKTVINLIEKVSDTLLSTKSPGDTPVRVSTKRIEMVVERGLVSEVGKGSIEVNGGAVDLPDSSTLFGNHGKQPAHIDTQMLLMKKNPFTWDKSAKKVTSPVLSIELKDDSGKKLVIEGLRKEIELVIKPPKEQAPAPVLRGFCKPSINGSMQYHTTNVTSEGKTMQLIVKPEDGKRLELYVRLQNRPTKSSYDYKTTVPDTSICNPASLDNCTEKFIVTVPVNVTKNTGLYYIGIRSYVREKADVKSRQRRSCSGSGRSKRSVVCVEFKDPPTTPAPTPMSVIPSYDNTTDVNYTISISLKSCLYWSEDKQTWTDYGCRVSTKMLNDSIVCLCNHLSSFGGDFFVAPNPIDFDKVWLALANIGTTKNFVVLSTLCTIFALYIIAIVLARRADRNDKLKITQAIPVAHVTDDSYCYEISVYTGIWRRCGTTSNIAMKLYGEEGDTETVSLSYTAMCNKQLFGRGSVNVFLYPSDKPLGDFNNIRIWHDNSGNHPAWFLRQIVIRDIQTDAKWFFVANKWLALEKDDGRIDRVFYVSSDNEINGFKNKFCSRAVSGIGDGHLWVSVVTRPPTSPFTRTQRATCCLCVLMTAMVANAMFYQFGEESKDSFKFGPLVVSLKQITIGIQSSIIVVPINIIIVLMFKNTRSKDENATKPADEPADAKKKQKKALPHFVVYIAWFLVISASLVSATFTLFYSMMWGRDISNQWLTSILVSFSQDVIFIQPIKVILLAVLLSFIIKKAPEDETAKETNIVKTKTAKHYNRISGEVKEPQSPKNEDLEQFRQYRVRVLMMARTLIELFFYLMFVWMLMVICYGSRDVGRYWMTHGLRDALPKFDKVKNEDGFWNWSRKYLVPGLYSKEWYNGQEFEYKEGFISNKAGYLVGMPRFRQLRAKPDDCPIKYLHPNFSSTVNQCIPPYSFEAEEKTLFNLRGWYPLSDNETRFLSEFELSNMCPRPWRYRTADELDNLPFQGEKELYGGGGYIADLGYNSRSALRVIDNLESNIWIDERTRAVFVEVFVFEPASSFFSAVTYLYEKLPTGGAVTYTATKTMSLYGARSHGMQSLYAICELVIILIVIYFVIAEFIKLYRLRWGYFKSLWTWIEMTQVIASIATIVLSIFRRYYASRLVEKVHKNPFMTSSFHYAVFWSEIESALMAILIFVITVKLLRILKFNQHISVLAQSMAKCGKKLVSYSAVFLVAFLAFSQVAVLVFGSTVPAYSSVVQVFRAQFSMFVGGETDYQSLKKANSALGPIYFFTFMVAMATILINMFLAILNEAYREVHLFKDVVPEEYKMFVVFLDYADRRLKRSFTKIKKTKLFPTTYKYDIKEQLLAYEAETDQKYTALDSESLPKEKFDEDPEDNVLAAVKGCFKALRSDLKNLVSRSRKYKVQEAFKRDRASSPDSNGCKCKGLKMKSKSISSSLHNIADDFYMKKKCNDEVKLLLDFELEQGYDATQDSDMMYSESDDGELFLENSTFFSGKPQVANDSVKQHLLPIQDRETHI